jgi:fatty acid desaturase
MNNFDMIKLKNDIDNLKKITYRDINVNDELSLLLTTVFIIYSKCFIGCILLYFDDSILNIIGSLFLGFFYTENWIILSHHILHRGYDKIQCLKNTKFNSLNYCKKFYRFLHWIDWIEPECWKDEHNKSHHYYLNEEYDPDNVENNNENLRKSNMHYSLKLIIVFFIMCTWRFTYFCHNVIRCKQHSEMKIRYRSGPNRNLNLTLKQLLYIIVYGYIPRFVFLTIIFPLPYVLLGINYYKILTYSFLSEIFTNIHSFLTLITNHSGNDLYKFDSNVPYNSGEFYYRQIIGSVDYTSKNLFTDIMQCFANYQIEHHIFPNESLLFYKKFHPLLLNYCKENNIQFIKHNIFYRLYKSIRILLGIDNMKLFNIKYKH